MTDESQEQNPLSRNFSRQELLRFRHNANGATRKARAAAVPLTKEDGTRYGGMFVLRANSSKEARAIADADPLHKAGLPQLHANALDGK